MCIFLGGLGVARGASVAGASVACAPAVGAPGVGLPGGRVSGGPRVQLGALAAVMESAWTVATLKRPVILSAHLSHSTLPATGGATRVSFTLRHAQSCELRLRSVGTLAVRVDIEVVPCSSQHFSRVVHVSANTSGETQSVVLELVVWHGKRTAKRLVPFLVAASAPVAPTGSTGTSTTVPVSTPTTTLPAPSTPPTSLAPGQYSESYNWSGYIFPSAATVVTYATGSWTVPTLDCSQTPSGAASSWVGTGGAGTTGGAITGDLLQTGVRDMCVSGAQVDEGWWEEVPAVPEVSFQGLSISPGDHIVASVSQTATGQWMTALEDVTTGYEGAMIMGGGWAVYTFPGNQLVGSSQGSTASLSYEGGYTAEWIEEDPALAGGSLLPFADYDTVTFGGLATNVTPFLLVSDEAVAIVQNNVVLSTPSAPSWDGFSVSYTGTE